MQDNISLDYAAKIAQQMKKVITNLLTAKFTPGIKGDFYHYNKEKNNLKKMVSSELQSDSSELQSDINNMLDTISHVREITAFQNFTVFELDNFVKKYPNLKNTLSPLKKDVETMCGNVDNKIKDNIQNTLKDIFTLAASNYGLQLPADERSPITRTIEQLKKNMTELLDSSGLSPRGRSNLQKLADIFFVAAENKSGNIDGLYELIKASIKMQSNFHIHNDFPMEKQFLEFCKEASGFNKKQTQDLLKSSEYNNFKTEIQSLCDFESEIGQLFMKEFNSLLSGDEKSRPYTENWRENYENNRKILIKAESFFDMNLSKMPQDDVKYYQQIINDNKKIGYGMDRKNDIAFLNELRKCKTNYEKQGYIVNNLSGHDSVIQKKLAEHEGIKNLKIQYKQNPQTIGNEINKIQGYADDKIKRFNEYIKTEDGLENLTHRNEAITEAKNGIQNYIVTLQQQIDNINNQLGDGKKQNDNDLLLKLNNLKNEASGIVADLESFMQTAEVNRPTEGDMLAFEDKQRQVGSATILNLHQLVKDALTTATTNMDSTLKSDGKQVM